jgi:hypothetical protein
LTAHFGQAESELQRLRLPIVAKLAEMRQEASSAGNASASSKEAIALAGLPQRVLDYFRLRLDQLAIAAAEHTVHLILSDVKSMTGEMASLGREIEQIAAAIARAANAGHAVAVGNAANDHQPSADARLRDKLPDLAAEVNARLQSEFIHPQGGLFKIVMQGGRPRALLATKLHELSLDSVRRFLAELDRGANGGSGSQLEHNMRSGLALATPSLLEYGGTRRVLAIVPRDSADATDAAGCLQASGAKLTTMTSADNSLALCVEADELSLHHVALDLVQRRRDRVEFAGRVHCRTDISWMPLVPIPAALAAAAWSGASNQSLRKTQPRQEMCQTLVM